MTRAALATFPNDPPVDGALREAWYKTHLDNAEKKESSGSKGGRGDLQQ